jgi:hypothetical protein
MAVALVAVATRTAARPGRPGEAAGPRTDVALHGLDEGTREQALLDAADRLYRNTPPGRF